jgi:hypothetical protein
MDFETCHFTLGPKKFKGKILTHFWLVYKTLQCAHCILFPTYPTLYIFLHFCQAIYFDKPYETFLLIEWYMNK